MAEPFKDDKKVVQLYLSGDQRTEKWLYAELKRQILKLINFMHAKGVAFSDKKNVVDEIIFKIMVADKQKVLRSYLGNSKLSTYLWPIVRNKIIDAFRKEMRYKGKELHQETFKTPLDQQTSNTSEIEAIIEEHISSSSAVERFIIMAKWIDGVSYDQIIAKAKQEFSDEVNINSQRIAFILHTNRKRLQKKLKNFRINFD